MATRLHSETPHKHWKAIVISASVDAAYYQAAFICGLIGGSAFDEQLFPLVRALNFVSSGEPAMIEQLTPEIRPIVEQAVERIRSAE